MKINQIVIHIEHGIGKYKGLVIIENNGIKGEYFVIEYAERAKLYVPVMSLNLITIYENQNIVNLNKLGTENWLKDTKKITQKIYDETATLLDIYAKRATQPGFPFIFNKKEYEIFCKKFPFLLTNDQKKVILEVINDMKSNKPMDRLICGDVGFGKTEIAMRASFLAINNNKQVAILVPTTLLVQQHYNNFMKRFLYLGINIKRLSRFCTPKEVSKVELGIKTGKTKILIATHQLLFKNLKWNNLGLLIVDEEHRFGVLQKEKIKSLFLNIDILTLTATPIPRTLNMALHGMRDLSIIATPPKNKLSVKTFVNQYHPKLIRKTILLEISRGGQVYYIYNKVQHLKKIALTLSKLIPEVKIQIGHGQMDEKSLEKVMSDFRNHDFDVLVCTTIIETGIDIPAANTMIIHQADKFGLAQLHQLRGRIGRADQQSYVLLLIENFETININAKKRLEAIVSYQDFGSGFILSKKDLEIRGIGKILGKDQSGHIKKIGFFLYKKILKSAIQSYKSGEKFSLSQLKYSYPEIELNLIALLPETYISDVNIRIKFYKKLVLSKSKKSIKNIKSEIIYKFGKLPNSANNLFIISYIRVMSNKLGIKKIYLNKKEGFMEFNSKNLINIPFLLKIIQSNPKIWKIDGRNKVRFFSNERDDKNRLQWIINFVTMLEKNINLN